MYGEVPRPRLLDAFFLAAVVAAGAWLRLCRLGVPSLWLDEIIHADWATQAMHLPLWRWVVGFEPENGALYVASELAGRFLPTPELAMRAAPALFGIAAIVVAYYAAAGTAARYVFPILLACAPLHVYYSWEGRPYALTLLLTIALLAAMLRGARPRVVIPLLLAAVYSAASIVPLLGAAAVAALFAYSKENRFSLAPRSGERVAEGRVRGLLIAGSSVACIVLVALLYRGEVIQTEYGFPALTAASFRSMLDSFSAAALDTSHLHRVAWLFLTFALVGAIAAPRRERAVALSFAVLPALLALLALWKLNHFFAVRYVACALPGFLLLVAMGVDALTRWLTKWVARWVPRAAPAVAILVAAFLVRDGLEAARREPFEKLDWRTIARTIASHSKPGDQVLVTNDWTAISLGFYLRELHVPVRLLNAQDKPEMALMFLSQKPEGWIASAGLPESSGIHDVACRFPVVLGLPLESFRLHWVPALDHFVATRSSEGERRALRASYGGTIDLTFGAGDSVLLDGRWGGPEPEEGRFARWALGHDVAVALPLGAPADRQLVFDAAPVSSPPQQRLTLRLNDQVVAAIPMLDGRHTYRIDAPRALWRDGANVLSLGFDRAVAPASLDPHSSDERLLAARFYRLTVLDAGQPMPPLPPPDRAHHLHLGDVLAPYAERALPVPDPLLAHRLGFDRADLPPAHLAMAFADDSGCLDDETFLRSAWLALFERPIAAGELAEMRRKLQNGTTRRELLRNLANAEVEKR
jgi:hypothetical protein